MKYNDFKKLSLNEKFYRVEQLTDLSLDCDFRERSTIINQIVHAKDEEDFEIALAMLEDFETSYKY